MRKVVSVVLATLLGFTVVLTTTGCVKSDEEILKDGLTVELSKYNDPASDVWEGLDTTEFANMGLDAKDVIVAWMVGFDFEVGEVIVNGNKAEVYTTITCKQINPAAKSAKERILGDNAYAGWPQAKIMAKVGEFLLADLRNAPTKTSTIVISCVKTNNKWAADPDGMEEIALALNGPQ